MNTSSPQARPEFLHLNFISAIIVNGAIEFEETVTSTDLFLRYTANTYAKADIFMRNTNKNTPT